VTPAEISSENLLRNVEAYTPTRFVSLESPNAVSLSQRLLLWLAVFGLHIAFVLWMNHELARDLVGNTREVVTVLEFIKRPKPVEIINQPIEPVEPIVNKKIKKPVIKPTTSLTIIKKPSQNSTPVTSQSVAPALGAKPVLRIYDDSGKIRLDPEFVENFDSKRNVPARFDFQNPDLELAGTFLKRPPAIDYEPTQFDQAWKPDQDVLTELLEKAVAKTTGEIKIPVPGNPTSKLVCKVSMLALAGGCGFVPNGGNSRVIAENEDDPNTLSPIELQACQAWWNKIIDTRSQREWLKTKGLYEQECKKPLAKEKVWPK
jgi:hypothetical protein